MWLLNVLLTSLAMGSASSLDFSYLEKCYALTNYQPEQQIFWQKSHIANNIKLHPRQSVSYDFHALVYFQEEKKELHVLQKDNYKTYTWNSRFERNCASEGSRQALPHEGECQGPPDCAAAIMGAGVQIIANKKGKVHYRLCDTEVARDIPIPFESQTIAQEKRPLLADEALQDRLRHLMSHIPDRKVKNKKTRQDILKALAKSGPCRKAFAPLSKESQALMAQIQCLLAKDPGQACTNEEFAPLKKNLNPLGPDKKNN